MVQRLFALLVVAFAAAVLPAGPVRASPLFGELCNEHGDDADDTPPPAAPEPDRVVLPCALADTASGCADAAIYVVSTGGVLLCQIDIPALAAQQGAPEVETRPAAPPSTTSGALASLGLPTASAAAPPVLVRDVVRALPPVTGGPRDGHSRLATPPS